MIDHHESFHKYCNQYSSGNGNEISFPSCSHILVCFQCLHFCWYIQILSTFTFIFDWNVRFVKESLCFQKGSIFAVVPSL